MKLLITALGFAVLAYACQNDFISAQQVIERDTSLKLSGSKEEQAGSFTANDSYYFFTNTGKQNAVDVKEYHLRKRNSTTVKTRPNVQVNESTAAKEVVVNKNEKRSGVADVFPAEDFLFLSLIMVN